jgi:hypothetical protein
MTGSTGDRKNPVTRIRIKLKVIVGEIFSYQVKKFANTIEQFNAENNFLKLRTKACAKQSLLKSKEGSVASLFLILFAKMTIVRRYSIVYSKFNRRAMNWHSANKRNNKLISKKPTIRSRGSLRKKRKKKS